MPETAPKTVGHLGESEGPLPDRQAYVAGGPPGQGGVPYERDFIQGRSISNEGVVIYDEKSRGRTADCCPVGSDSVVDPLLSEQDATRGDSQVFS